MLLGCARETAVHWVERNVAGSPWFFGAHFSGSSVGLPDDAEWPSTSDVDVVVVTRGRSVPPKPGKFIHDGVLIEVSYRSWDRLSEPDVVLASHQLAPGFRVDTIIADPTGALGRLQCAVEKSFADPRWIRARCGAARRRSEELLLGIDENMPWHDQVTSWLFGTGITTHLVLVAALRNPTVRLRYPAAREVLYGIGEPDTYEVLLRHLGCAHLDPEPVRARLAELRRVFDTAASFATTRFPFSADITDAGREVAIDGSRDLVNAGMHREAVFWMVATFARCQKVLAADAPDEVRRSAETLFGRQLADIGIGTSGDLVARARSVLRFMPVLWETVERLLDTRLDGRDV